MSGSTILIAGSLAESLVNFRGDLIRELISRGHTVHVCAPAGPTSIDEKLSEWGVKRHTLNLSRAGLNPIRDLVYFKKMAELIRSIRPDLFFGYTIKPVVFGAIAAKISGVSNIAVLITGLGYAFMPTRNWSHQLTKALARTLYRLALPCANKILFQNRDDAQEFARLNLIGKHLTVGIVNGSGVNLEHFAPSPLPPGQPRNVLMIARLLADKGVREYIEAATQVKAKYPDISFDLIGPFDENPTAVSRSEIQAAEAKGIIQYRGALDDVRPSLRACHVYVLPSYREGTPRSVLEAMAMGRPIITTDAPGCRDTTVDGFNGLLVPVRDATALAAAIMEVLSKSDLELQAIGDNSLAMAREKFDVWAVNRQIIKIIGLQDAALTISSELSI